MLLKYHGEKVDISSYLVQPPTTGYMRVAQNRHILHDPFCSLPVEIREHLLELLPIRDISALRTASYPMHNIVLSNALRKQVFSATMPWLYEIEDFLNQGNKYQTFDLCLTIGELERRSTYCGDFDGLDLILANRRRVWLVCERIATQYAGLLKETAGCIRRWTPRDDGSFEVSVLPGA